MGAVYHVSVGGVKQGPFGEAELGARIAEGAYSGESFCWSEGWTGWRRLDEVFPLQADGQPRLPGSAVPPGPPVEAPQDSRCAIASLFFGICTVVFFPLFPLFMVPAIVCGHLARARIRRAKGALVGGGLALAGLILGYLGVVAVPVGGIAAAVALPRIEKFKAEKRLAEQVKQKEAAELQREAMCKTVDHDARQIAAAAQQYYLETMRTSVALSYEPATGALGGPLAGYVRHIARGYAGVPERLTLEKPFQLLHPAAGAPRHYDSDGTPLD